MAQIPARRLQIQSNLCFDGRKVVQDSVCVRRMQRLDGVKPRTSLRRENALAATKGDKDLLSNIEDDLKVDESKQEPPRKGFGAQQTKPKSKRKTADRPFTVQNALDQPPTASDQIESNIVRVLAFLFILFFCEGIFLAIAGFLPEAADKFAVDYVYPAFSPTLGVFLLISVVYGLLKTRGS